MLSIILTKGKNILAYHVRSMDMEDLVLVAQDLVLFIKEHEVKINLDVEAINEFSMLTSWGQPIGTFMAVEPQYAESLIRRGILSM